MMLKLSLSECTAIDLVLDLAIASSQNVLAAAVSTDGTTGSVETNSVKRLLDLLDTFPAQDPAPDLVMRTLTRIEQSPNAIAMLPSFIASLSANPAQ